MNSTQPFIRIQLALALVLSVSTATSSAAILSVAGNDTLVGSRPANLITNGSFEDDDGVAANGSYWATGTTNSPAMSISGWTASGQVSSYAIWGNDGFGGIMLSDMLPHGSNGVYFGGGIMASVSPLPTEAPNGLVTFSSTPTITPKPTDGPVTLQQTVSGLNPSSTYLLDFWTSGESVGPFGFAMDGFFGLNISSEPPLYFAAPSGNGPIGLSQRYQIYFTPTTSTVTFEWVNWGHYTDANGMSDELVLDDVILNLVSNVPPPLDCNCITNIILACPAVVPDLCAMFSSCFTTNMLPGSCTQNFPPGMPLSVGTYPLQLQVMDLQSNTFSCIVTIDVLPPDPATPLTLDCPTNKTVECGSNWSFDQPTVLSSCCGVNITWLDTVVSNSPCDIQYTRTWVVTDGCNNVDSCNQTVTTVDTTPPGGPCAGINLVPNGSFELTTNCPNAISLFDYAAPWFTPTSGTSDLFSDCGGTGGSVTVPTNMAGIHPAASGNNYAGAVLYSVSGTTSSNSYREYLEVPLLSTLAPGQQYLVSFRVRRAHTWGWAIADIGARFLPLAYTDFGPSNNVFAGVLPFSAQVENPNNNIITSTNSWTLIQGVYTAVGWENHLVLGNFKDDPSTTATFIGGEFNNYAYYLFDDVSVVAVCDPSATNKVVQCGEPLSLDPFPIVDNCSGDNITVSSVTTTSGVCPQVIERIWTVSDACGNADTLTQTVTIVDTNPPVLLCGANLVPNPHFENFATCPYFFGQVPTAAPWFNPTVATPDYLNTCTTFAPVGVPANWFGNETPNSGNGYMGAYCYSVYGTNPVPGYREYIEAPLLAPLQAGVTYQVSFHVSLADSSGWAIAELGAHLSVGPVTDGSTQGPLNVVPQVSNPSSFPLTITNGWMLVSGTYTAVGGEDHITLGNFLDDASTTAVTAAGTNHTYYYFDDIAVVPLCALTNKTVICGQPWTFDEPAGLDDCSGTNVAVTVVSTITNNLACPLIVTRTWSLTDLCGNVATVSQTVTNLDTAPPIPQCAAGINLVPNGQFESFTQCPTGLSLVSFATPWYPPTDGTSDYFNSCATPGSFVNTSSNFIGSQAPFSGEGYVGAYAYSLTWNYREYVQVPLLAPLVASQTYPVSFRVSLADNSGWAVAELGAHFSAGAVLSGSTTPLNLVPQVANVAPNFLTSTNGWMLIQGNYTAVGGETHLTLGNFLNDASTTVTPAAGFEASISYYYFDDVRVEAPCNDIAPEKIFPCGVPWEFDTVTGYDACSGTNITITSVTVTNSLCPLQLTRTWTLTDLCGNATNVSQTIIIIDSQPPVVNCDCLLDTTLDLLSTNGCSGVIPDLAALTNSPCLSDNCGPLQVLQSPVAGTIVGPGSHPISLTFSDCGGNSTNCMLYYQVTGPAVTLSVPPTLHVLTCSNSLPVNFSVTASNNVGPVVCIPASGSLFPIGTNLVTCIATNPCGGTITNNFNVVVRHGSLIRWGCITKVIGIPYEIISLGGGGGGSSAFLSILPDLPDGGHAALFDNLGSSGQDGVRFDFGAAQAFSFTTELDFNAATGAGFDLNIPPGPGETNGNTLLSVRRAADGHMHVSRPASDPMTSFRSTAIGTNGVLFDSFTLTAAELNTNILATIAPMNDVTNVTMNVTVDCLTHAIELGFPQGDWMPDASRKGWDGCIYGPDRPIKKTNSAARLIFTPVNPVLPPPITSLNMVVSNLVQWPIYNPSITSKERKWSDGHVTLMKAYDDGSEAGMDFLSLGEGGGVSVELGHAASFSFRREHFHNGDIPDQDELYRVIGWPPGTTTNRPAPPTNYWRLTPGTDGNGLPAVEVAADFTQWGVSNITIQLLDGGAIVGETNLPATLAATLVALDQLPTHMGSPSMGVLSLAATNRMTAVFGLACTSGTCEGDELRIIADSPPTATPPLAYTGLEIVVNDGMDMRLANLQTTPACAPESLSVTRDASSVTITWDGDGFRLQGAETLAGPWHDLGVSSPVTLPVNSSLRLFRLICN